MCHWIDDLSTKTWIDSVCPRKGLCPRAGPFSGAELIYPAPEKGPALGQRPFLGQNFVGIVKHDTWID